VAVSVAPVGFLVAEVVVIVAFATVVARSKSGERI
jgi:hypothetical protein